MKEGLPIFAQDMENGTRQFLRNLVGSARQERLELSDHLTGADQRHGTGAAGQPATLVEKQEQMTKEMRSLLDSIPGKTSEPAADQVERRPTATETVQRMQSRLQDNMIRLQAHFADIVQRDSEKKQKKMKQEIREEADAAAAKATEEVYDRYRQDTPRSWNESEKDRTLRSLAQGLRASRQARTE